jgi:tRNA A-37 threonylcarbamoyl transferase component Bud32
MNINNVNVSGLFDSINTGNVNASGLFESVFGTSRPELAGPACASVLKTRLSSDKNDYGCSAGTGYRLYYFRPANVNDIPFLCMNSACKAALDLARSIATSECVVNGEYYLYQDILNPIIRHCANLTTGAPSTNTSATPAHTGEAPLSGNWTVATAAPSASTISPSSSDYTTSDDDGVSPIVYIVGSVFVVLMIASVVRCLKQNGTSSPPAQREQYLVYGHEDERSATPAAPAVYVKVVGDDNQPSKTKQQPPTPPTSIVSEPPARSTIVTEDLSKLPLLNDAQIVAVRVPFDKVWIGEAISTGGYGEVYNGTYKGETVAIKKMLPEHRRDGHIVTKFLEEIKLMASLDHERIVRFVGVAWQSPSDICVLTEFMDGGDLRSLLKRYEDEHRAEGFDSTKLKIALHVAHAMTYMHSLQPVLLHRDLKSSNVLLSKDMDAKITDFGVSRERGDATMTRGVGSSLWMAPEIMMGGRYDEKADIFSFGVVLSELDSNKLPYANQVDLKNAKFNYGEIMHSVAQGRLAVDFSYESDPDIVALGRDCVSLDPQDRPAAAEVLHRVHQVLRQYQH